VAEWTEEFRRIWETRFDNLERYLQQLQAKQTTENRHGRKRRSK
jgi:hypothetical protein